MLRFREQVEHQRGAADVDGSVFLDFVHRLPGAGLGGQMNHGVLSLEGPQPVAAVGHAAAQEAYPVAEAAIKRGGPLGVLAVNLGRQAVEHGDFVSLIGELEREPMKPAPPVIRMFFIITD